MPDKSRDLYRGILIPDGDISKIWTEESTIDQEGNRAGVPDTLSRTEAVIESSGHQDAAGDGQSLEVLTLRGGYPAPGGAGFGWNKPDSLSPIQNEYRGWDVPHQISAWENSRWSTPGNPHFIHGDLINVTREDGSDFMLCAYDLVTAGVSVNVAIQTRSGEVWSTAASFPLSSLQPLVSVYTCHPAILALPSGRILVFYWIYDHGNSKAQIQMAYNDGEGSPAASWKIGGEYTLSEPIDITDIETGRIRVAYKDGQILLVMALFDTTAVIPSSPYILAQYASDDLGATFSEIVRFDGSFDAPSQLWDAGARPDVTVSGETFVVGWLSPNDLALGVSGFAPTVQRLGSAYEPLNPKNLDPISSLFPVGCFDLAYPGTGDLTIASDEDGSIYLLTTLKGDDPGPYTQTEGVALRSYDGGETWVRLGLGAGVTANFGRWWGGAPPGESQSEVFPQDYTAEFSRSQLVLVHNYTNNTADPVPAQGLGESSLCFLYLGSYSTVTLPGLELFKADSQRVALPVTWLPFCIPSSLPTWTAMDPGPPTTEEIEIPGRLHLVVPAAIRYRYAVNPGNGNGETEVAYTDGFIGRFTYQNDPTSAGVQRVSTRVYDGAGTFIGLNMDMATATGLLVIDPIAGGSLAQWLPGALNKIQVFYAIRGTDDGGDPPVLGGECCVYARVWTPGEDRAWNLLYQGPLTPSAGGSTSFVRWGDPELTTASNVFWDEFNLCYGHTAAGEPLTGEHFAQGQINPGDLFPRSYAAAPLFVDANTRIATVDGPTFEGDLWSIDTRFLDAADNVIPAVAPSPAKPWRSKTATAGDAIAFQRNADGENAFPLNCLYGVHFQNVNFKRARIETMIGAAWVAAGDCELFEAFQFERRGNTLHIANGVAEKMYCYYNEFAGCKFEFNPDDVDSQVATILRNSEGMSYSGAAPKTTTIALDPETFDTATAPVSGIGHIWFKTITYLLEFPINGRFVGIRAVLCPTGTLPPEGHFEAGIIAPGPVGVFGWDYSRERAITKTPNVELLTLRDGTRHAYQAGGRRKKVAFSWAEGVDETELRLTGRLGDPTADPGYVTTSTAGAPMALRQDGPFFMWGLMDRLDGPALPVIYIPRIEFLFRPRSPIVRFDPRQNNRGAIYSRLTTPITLEQVVGDEETSEVYRVNSVTFEEEL